MSVLRWMLVAGSLGVGCAPPSLAQEIVVFGRPEKTEQWVQKLLIWRSGFTPGSDDPAQTPRAAWSQIEAIDDPAATPAIVALLKVEKESRFRHALIWSLIDLEGRESTATLVKLSVLDGNWLLRQEVADALACRPELPEYVDQYIRYLYKPQFATAAAQALRRTRLTMRDKAEPVNPQLAKALIAALVQKQEKRLPFSRTYGGVVPVGVEPFPHDVRWLDVQVPIPNPEVYEALKEYSLEDHRYDKQRWSESLIYSKRR
jgi:hypothetical protein